MCIKEFYHNIQVSETVDLLTSLFLYKHFPDTSLQVATNGIISFGAAFYDHEPVAFPSGFSSVANSFLTAPFWSDVDIRKEGEVFYEVHQSSNTASAELLASVNSAINANTDAINFNGTWMLVAKWENVGPYPIGSDNEALINLYDSVYGDVNKVSKHYLNHSHMYLLRNTV